MDKSLIIKSVLIILFAIYSCKNIKNNMYSNNNNLNKFSSNLNYISNNSQFNNPPCIDINQNSSNMNNFLNVMPLNSKNNLYEFNHKYSINNNINKRTNFNYPYKGKHLNYTIDTSDSTMNNKNEKENENVVFINSFVFSQNINPYRTFTTNQYLLNLNPKIYFDILKKNYSSTMYYGAIKYNINMDTKFFDIFKKNVFNLFHPKQNNVYSTPQVTIKLEKENKYVLKLCKNFFGINTSKNLYFKNLFHENFEIFIINLFQSLFGKLITSIKKKYKYIILPLFYNNNYCDFTFERIDVKCNTYLLKTNVYHNKNEVLKLKIFYLQYLLENIKIYDYNKCKISKYLFQYETNWIMSNKKKTDIYNNSINYNKPFFKIFSINTNKEIYMDTNSRGNFMFIEIYHKLKKINIIESDLDIKSPIFKFITTKYLYYIFGFNTSQCNKLISLLKTQTRKELHNICFPNLKFKKNYPFGTNIIKCL